MSTPAALAGLVQGRQAAEALALEEQAAAEADGGAAEALAVIAAAAVAAWAARRGTRLAVDASAATLGQFLADLRRRITTVLVGLGERAQSVLRRALTPAGRLGTAHALTFASRTGAGTPAQPDPSLPRDVLDAVASLADDITRQTRTAIALLQPATVQRLGGLRGLLAGLGAARRATTMTRTRIAWVIQRAVNSASRAVADTLGLGLLWIAEPDACPTCRAYSGLYAPPGADFPGGLSLDPAQRRYFPEPIPAPPRHPNCRCRAVPWSPSFGRALPTHLAARARSTP